MATIVKNKIIKNVGKKLQEIIDTEQGSFVCIGLSLTNLLNQYVYLDIFITDDTSVTGYYLKNTLLPGNTSLRPVSVSEKLMLMPNNKMSVVCSEDDALDVVFSYADRQLD